MLNSYRPGKECNMAEKVWKILLLTNRDSDNVGDQVIEACDISLISAVMKNLNIEDDRYMISSQVAGIVSKRYLETRSERLYKKAEAIIKDSDIIIFGGAPMFNYGYQIFYERTAVTLEIAEKHHKPVLFSAIGVEGYDEENEKCQRLKKTLNFDCVKQITTRDDFDSLKKFIVNENVVIDKVSDPAVFASSVFRKYIDADAKKPKKKLGVFILRSNGFTDNKIDFSRDEAAALWKGLSKKLKRSGYDYEFITSGHFGDEAFLDNLIRSYGINVKKCVFNINSPERLIQKIASYDVVISCRLHPSIISFALDVPSLGIIWNSKVKYFYDSIGYENRVIDIKEISAEGIVEKAAQILEHNEGVEKDRDYLMSVYNTLFYGIRGIVCMSEAGADEAGIKDLKPYEYKELLENIPPYKGTTPEEYDEKLQRKFRRAYGKYNELFEKNQKGAKFTLIYNGGTKSEKLTWNFDEVNGEVKKLDTGSVEYELKKPVLNNGKTGLVKNGFCYPGAVFAGWQMRARENDKWYWYLEDGSFKPVDSYDKNKDKPKCILKDSSVIPYIPEMEIDVVVLEGVWDMSWKMKMIQKIRHMK